jgi:hypothetical protein
MGTVLVEKLILVQLVKLLSSLERPRNLMMNPELPTELTPRYAVEEWEEECSKRKEIIEEMKKKRGKRKKNRKRKEEG